MEPLISQRYAEETIHSNMHCVLISHARRTWLSSHLDDVHAKHKKTRQNFLWRAWFLKRKWELRHIINFCHMMVVDNSRQLDNPAQRPHVWYTLDVIFEMCSQDVRTQDLPTCTCTKSYQTYICMASPFFCGSSKSLFTSAPLAIDRSSSYFSEVGSR